MYVYKHKKVIRFEMNREKFDCYLNKKKLNKESN